MHTKDNKINTILYWCQNYFSNEIKVVGMFLNKIVSLYYSLFGKSVKKWKINSISNFYFDIEFIYF